MVLPYDLHTAFSILKKPCNYVQSTNLSADNYQDVIDIWKYHKNTGSLPDDISNDRFMHAAFDFHKNSELNHGILYYSKYLSDALILYKIRNKYFNILIPSYSLFDKNKSIIAIYSD